MRWEYFFVATPLSFAPNSAHGPQCRIECINTSINTVSGMLRCGIGILLRLGARVYLEVFKYLNHSWSVNGFYTGLTVCSIFMEFHDWFSDFAVPAFRWNIASNNSMQPHWCVNFHSHFNPQNHAFRWNVASDDQCNQSGARCISHNTEQTAIKQPTKSFP